MKPLTIFYYRIRVEIPNTLNNHKLIPLNLKHKNQNHKLDIQRLTKHFHSIQFAKQTNNHIMKNKSNKQTQITRKQFAQNKDKMITHLQPKNNNEVTRNGTLHKYMSTPIELEAHKKLLKIGENIEAIKNLISKHHNDNSLNYHLTESLKHLNFYILILTRKRI